MLALAITASADATALSLAESGVDVNGEWGGITHLTRASGCNRVAVVACFLELGAGADNASDGGETPLAVASFSGHQGAVGLLVEMGNAQLDKRDASARTALHAAACGGQLETVKYLAARGSSLDAQNMLGETALACAEYIGYPLIVQFLTDASRLTTSNDYSGLLSLCGISSPFLERKISSSLRYAIILSVHQARHIIDGPKDSTPIHPFLRHLATIPSADNSSPNTEGQVLRRILSFGGTGFDVDVLDAVSSRTRSRVLKRKCS
jgi:ankyrin repeat protein